MTGASITAGPPAAPRWVWMTLFGSLAVNLVIAGVVLGHRMRPPPQHGPGLGGRMHHGGPAAFVRDLSPERRDELRGIFERHRGEHRALWQALRDRHADVKKALETEPFDKTAYVATMTRFIEAEAAARTAVQPTFAEIAAALTLAERRDFVINQRHIRQQLLGPGKGPGKQPDKGPGDESK